jgi:hypothetical protein
MSDPLSEVHDKINQINKPLQNYESQPRIYISQF